MKDDVETHVKVLGVLYLVLGGLGVLLALTLMLVFGSAFGLIGASGDPDAVQALPIVGLAGTTLVTLTLILSLPGVVIGIGLLQRKSWARIGGIVLAICCLIGFPIGTIIGIYGLWVLFSRETEQLFLPAQPAPPTT
jgi:hypothetical protein